MIVPSLSFIATANAVWHCGATPVFADVDPETTAISIPSTSSAGSGRRTKASYRSIRSVCRPTWTVSSTSPSAHGLAVVEDAACAVGAEYRGRTIGSLGPLACFSFHPRKVITCGEGGMIAVQDPMLAERLRRLRQHAMDRSALGSPRRRTRSSSRRYPERGWNARMTDLQAAVGIRQLGDLDEILRIRRRLADRYTAALERGRRHRHSPRSRVCGPRPGSPIRCG